MDAVEIVGYGKTPWSFPTFIVPVLLTDGGYCIQQIDADDTVVGTVSILESEFERLPPISIQGGLMQKRIFGFAFSAAEVRFGAKGELVPFIRAIDALVSEESVTSAHIAHFLGNEEIAQRRTEYFRKTVIENSPELGVLWSASPDYKGPASNISERGESLADDQPEKTLLSDRMPSGPLPYLRLSALLLLLLLFIILGFAAYHQNSDAGNSHQKTKNIETKSITEFAAKEPDTVYVRIFAKEARSDKFYAWDGPNTFPYYTSAILFEFTLSDFSSKNGKYFETFIDGIDSTWITVSGLSSEAIREILNGRKAISGEDLARREIVSIRDGQYTLRVRMVANDGTRSAETTVRFAVLPPWWRTAPVLASIAAAFFPLGYALFHLRVRALRRRNSELEQRVVERTKELETANAELAQASAAKTEFVANMSHDIRNPLNGIVGLALALEDCALPVRAREMVSTLRECTGYLSTLVDDVLDFASIEAGRVDLRPAPFSPIELLRSIVATLKSETADRGAAVIVDVARETPPHLLGDAGRIQQILVNFVSNALKYAGGEITLSVRVLPHTPDIVEFAVSDNGPGLSSKEQENLFRKFSRLTRSAEDIPGHGLGLASCRLLADLMGGAVGVESEVGSGSRFFLRIPLTILTSPPERETSVSKDLAVLLVEDTDYNAWAAVAILARLGLSCDRAMTGKEALQKFRATRYNVVLLDRNLPDMDGAEVAREMRIIEGSGGRAVILAVTAYCTAEDRMLCLKAGMDAFVGKPLTPAKLRGALLAVDRRNIAAPSVGIVATFDNRESTPHESVNTDLDLSLLTYLSDGTDSGLERQIDRFLSTLDHTMNLADESMKVNNFDQLAIAAHRIVGQGKMIASPSLTSAADDLEKSARSDTKDTVAQDLKRLKDECKALSQVLRLRLAPGAV